MTEKVPGKNVQGILGFNKKGKIMIGTGNLGTQKRYNEKIVPVRKGRGKYCSK